MLQWLRNTGDLARLRQEMRRFHVDSAALPAPLLSELVAIAQRNFDSARSDGMPHDLLQATFDASWRAAAAMPLIAVEQPATAARSIGQWLYDEILEDLVENCGNGSFYRELLAACRKWQRNPNPSLDAVLRNQVDAPPLDAHRPAETPLSRSPKSCTDAQPPFDENSRRQKLGATGVTRHVDPFESWLTEFKRGAASANKLLSNTDAGNLIDFMDHSPLRQAFSDGVEPYNLGVSIADKFDFSNFFGGVVPHKSSSKQEATEVNSIASGTAFYLQPDAPDFARCDAIRKYKLGQFMCVLVKHPHAIGQRVTNGAAPFTYIFAMIFIDDMRNVRLIVTSEVSGRHINVAASRAADSSHDNMAFLCLFREDGTRENFGKHEGLHNENVFSTVALNLCAKEFGLENETAYTLQV